MGHPEVKNRHIRKYDLDRRERERGRGVEQGVSVFTYGMSAVRLPDDIGGEGSDGVDGDVVGRQRGKPSHRSQLSL